MSSSWGDSQTQFFFHLTPERVLEAVERSGLRCTGWCMALNSFENRVYDVELDLESMSESVGQSEVGLGYAAGVEEGRKKALQLTHRVVKFYRPGRWSRAQIQDEHDFLLDLQAAEIPVIAPLRFSDGSTLHEANGLYFALFPKMGGRAPDELTFDQLNWVGRLLGRIHGVGASRVAPHRVHLNPSTYGRANLKYLQEKQWIPPQIESRYAQVVESICNRVEPWFEEVRGSYQRLHGDCHLGNLLWNAQGPFFVDFDDMVMGPPVQDFWLLLPAVREGFVERMEALLEGYEQFRPFDRRTLRLIEPLRALRFVHYSGWLARRWEDPAFPRAFPQFGESRYWEEQLRDLEAQRDLIFDGTASSAQSQFNAIEVEDEDDDNFGNR